MKMIIGILLLFTLISCGEEVPGEQASACANGTSTENCDCFKATNKERLNNNLPAMAFCETCFKMAQEHADSMAQYSYFSHDRPAVGGLTAETFYARASRYGLGMAGENIASGAAGAGAVLMWMNSPGHKANILNSGFKSFACGYKSGYAVQVFSGSLF